MWMVYGWKPASSRGDLDDLPEPSARVPARCAVPLAALGGVRYNSSVGFAVLGILEVGNGAKQFAAMS